MEIYIHRNNEEFGPYSREAALEYMKQGVFEPSNYGWHAGLKDWMPLGDLLAPATVPATQGAFFTFEPQSPPRRLGERAHFQSRSRQTAQTPREPKHTGAMILLNLLLLSLVVGAGCLRLGLGGEMVLRCSAAIRDLLQGQSHETQQARPASAATKAKQPETAQAASTALRVALTPASRPIVPQNPAPPPAFDPAELAGKPAEWPRMVMLKEACVFPAIYNSQVVGSVKEAERYWNIKPAPKSGNVVAFEEAAA